MARHIINKNELLGMVKEIEIASSFGKDESKKLVAHVNLNNKRIDFRVINHGETLTVEQDLDTAIDFYNEI